MMLAVRTAIRRTQNVAARIKSSSVYHSRLLPPSIQAPPSTQQRQQQQLRAMTVSTSLSASRTAPKAPIDTPLLDLPNVNVVGANTIGKDAARTALLRATRDFRSDTVTAPTASMSAAMAQAAGGDNVYGDDVTSNAFEQRIATLFGKQAGLFVPTGTLSNQLCLRTWLMQPPYAIVCDARAHIHAYEAGGCAFHSGAAVETVTPRNGLYVTWDDIEPHMCVDDNIHHAPTRIVSLENTINGVIVPQQEIVRIAQNVRALDPTIKLHLDGARIWHVAAKTGLSLAELCAPFDSVSVCFSKGLGAPLGSMMLGPQAFTRKANHFRKLFGAGMRQVGVVTSAAQVAVQETFYKLPYVHDLASWLADELVREGAIITLPVDTCMVWFDPTPMGISIAEIIQRGAELPTPFILNGSRVVIHHQTDVRAVEDLLAVVRQLKAERAATAGTVQGL